MFLKKHFIFFVFSIYSGLLSRYNMCNAGGA